VQHNIVRGTECWQAIAAARQAAPVVSLLFAAIRVTHECDRASYRVRNTRAQQHELRNERTVSAVHPGHGIHAAMLTVMRGVSARRRQATAERSRPRIARPAIALSRNRRCAAQAQATDHIVHEKDAARLA
jgi:hypothetical protein